MAPGYSSAASSVGSGIGTIAQSGISGTGLVIIIVICLVLAVIACIAAYMKHNANNDTTGEIHITDEELALREKIMEQRRIREGLSPKTTSPRSSSEFSDTRSVGDGGAVIPPWERTQRGERADRRERNSQERSLLLDGERNDSDQRERNESPELRSGGRLRVPEPTVPPRSPRSPTRHSM